MGYTTVYFGGVTFDASNIIAEKVPGTLKQIIGKRVVHRRIPHRDVWDWKITISGVFVGTTAEIGAFKESLYALFGSKQTYRDGVSQHDGEYLIETNGLSWDENPDKYDNEYITFTIKLIQYNQT